MTVLIFQFITYIYENSPKIVNHFDTLKACLTCLDGHTGCQSSQGPSLLKCPWLPQKNPFDSRAKRPPVSLKLKNRSRFSTKSCSREIRQSFSYLIFFHVALLFSLTVLLILIFCKFVLYWSLEEPLCFLVITTNEPTTDKKFVSANKN